MKALVSVHIGCTLPNLVTQKLSNAHDTLFPFPVFHTFLASFVKDISTTILTDSHRF
jgi:hypothetical protein